MGLAEQSPPVLSPAPNNHVRYPAVGFFDGNGQNWLVMSGASDVSGAINYLGLSNAVAGSGPVLAPVSNVGQVKGAVADTNVPITVQGLGTGLTILGSATSTVSVTGAASILGNETVAGTLGVTGLSTLGSATVTGALTTVSLNVTGVGTISQLSITSLTAPLGIVGSNANALTVGVSGATSALSVDTSVASAANGLQVQGTASGASVNLNVKSAGPNDGMVFTAVGNGGFAFTSTSAAALVVGANGATNPVLRVNGSFASAANGLAISGTASAAGALLNVISAGPNESLTINAKGTGNILIGVGGITGNIGSLKFADLTVSGLTNNVNVPSIPTGFSSIRVIGMGRMSGAVTNGNVAFTINNDTGSNYDFQFSQSNGALLPADLYTSGAASGFLGFFPGSISNRSTTRGSFQATLAAYTDTTFDKSVLSQSAMVDTVSSGSYILNINNGYRSTVAVNGLSIQATTGTAFATGSRFIVMLDN